MKYPSITLSMLQRQLISLAFATLLFTIPTFAAETRGVKRVEIKTQAGELVGLYEQSHALVIGVSDYTAGWPDLEVFQISFEVILLTPTLRVSVNSVF